MAKSYAQHFSTRSTPQTEAIPGKVMVPNEAGGFSFPVDDWTRLDRFLVLGNEGGSYYVMEKKMTVENAQSVLRCFDADPQRVVNRIVEISEQGRAPKNDPAIFALAMAFGHPKAKTYAEYALPKVCRIGTHLFQFAEAVKYFRGRGRLLTRSLANWYLQKDPADLSYQCVKYQQRNGWSHRDILRLCKPKGAEGALNTVLKWAVGKQDPEGLMATEPLGKIVGFEQAKKATDKKVVARLILEYDLPRECVPTQFLTEAVVWEALLEKMPLTAMIRNLATMTRVGLLAPLSNSVHKVAGQLTDPARIRKARVHPIQILSALLTYNQGKGEKGSNTWTPVSQVVDALNEAFYLAFANVEPTGKNWLLGLDVSGSMRGTMVNGMPYLSAVQAEAAMALVTARTEENYFITGFDDRIHPVTISPGQRLDDVTRKVSSLVSGGTDCSLPMLYAAEKNIPVDVFAIFTDSQTWAGSVHPIQALDRYRQKTGRPAKLITVAMCASEFTIGDQADGGCLQVVGFDTNAPSVMSDFAR